MTTTNFSSPIADRIRIAALIPVFIAFFSPMQQAAKKVVFEPFDPEKIDVLNEKAVDFLAADFDRTLMRATQFAGEGDYLKAAQYYLAFLRFNLNDSTSIYNLACCYARLGKADLAVKCLVMAVRAGFREFKILENDKDFASIRHSEEFRKLLARIPLWEESNGQEIFIQTGRLQALKVKIPHGADPTRKLPLLVGLHGNGDSPDHMMGAMSRALRNDAVILAAPHGAYPNFAQLRGQHFSWAMQTRKRELWRMADTLAVDNLNEAVRALKERYPVGEVYILGFSQGAAFAFLCGFKFPEMVAGVVSIGGQFPEIDSEFSILTGKEIQNGKKFRVFIAQGTKDPLIPAGLGARTAERLKTNGYEVEYQDYDGGHEISLELVKKIYAWMERR